MKWPYTFGIFQCDKQCIIKIVVLTVNGINFSFLTLKMRVQKSSERSCILPPENHPFCTSYTVISLLRPEHYVDCRAKIKMQERRRIFQVGLGFKNTTGVVHLRAYRWISDLQGNACYAIRLTHQYQAWRIYFLGNGLLGSMDLLVPFEADKVGFLQSLLTRTDIRHSNEH